MSSAWLAKREDVQTWKNRLVGKRLVSSRQDIANHQGWKAEVSEGWEPRVYFSIPLHQGFDKHVQYALQPDSPLLKLPAEIRIHILEHVLPPDKTREDAIVPAWSEAGWTNTSAVIFTCKQLYAEGRALALETHTYDFAKLPRKTRLGAIERSEDRYEWDL